MPPEKEPTVTSEQMVKKMTVKLSALEKAVVDKTEGTTAELADVKSTAQEANNLVVELSTNVADLSGRIDNMTKANAVDNRHAYERERGGFGRYVKDLMQVKLSIDITDTNVRLAEWEKTTKTATSKLLSLDQRTDIGSKGGFLAPSERASETLKLAFADHPILGAVDRKTTSHHAYQAPILKQLDAGAGLAGGAVSYFKNEYDDLVSSGLSFEEMQIDLHEVYTRTDASMRMLEEDEYSVETQMRDSMSESLRSKLEDVIIHGTGVKQPEGFINANCKITVAKEGAQPAGTLTGNNILDMSAQVIDEDSAVFLYGPQMRKVLPKLKGDDDELLYLNRNQGILIGERRPILNGFPVIKSNFMQPTGTEGDIFLINPKAYRFVTRSTERFDSSMHLLFDQDAMAFRLVFVAGGKVWLPRALPLPNDPSFLVSPVVTVETRD